MPKHSDELVHPIHGLLYWYLASETASLLCLQRFHQHGNESIGNVQIMCRKVKAEDILNEHARIYDM